MLRSMMDEVIYHYENYIIMRKFANIDIENFMKTREFKNPKSANPYRSVLRQFKKLQDNLPSFEKETMYQLIQRHNMGRSIKSAQSHESIIRAFCNYIESDNIDIFSDPDPASNPHPKDSAQLAEELRQKQELAKIQAEELAKTQAEAKQEAQRLEQLRLEEARKKAEEEARKKQEVRKARIKSRRDGFEVQEFPSYIESFDYLGNIPTNSREYFDQKGESNIFNLLVDIGKHVILSGPAGTGKTELVIKKAKEDETPIFKFSCSSDVRMDDLIGTKTITEDGSIKFQAGMLLKAVLTANKYGKSILLLDEINTLSEKVQKNLNGLTDGTGFIDLPMGRIRINQGTQFVICGTMNLSYAGTNPLNPELKDRFTIIDMPKLSNETKHKIYSNFNVSCDEDDFIEMCNTLDEYQQENKISGDVTFSTRSQIAFLEVLEELEVENVPNAVRKSLDITLVSKFDDIDDKNQVRELVNKWF